MIHKIFEHWFRNRISLFPKIDQLSQSTKAEVVSSMMIVKEHIIEEILEGKPWIDKLDEIWERRDKELAGPGVQALVRIENEILSQDTCRTVERFLSQVCVIHDFVVTPLRVERLLTTKLKSALDCIEEIMNSEGWKNQDLVLEEIVKSYEEQIDSLFEKEIEKHLTNFENAKDVKEIFPLKIGSTLEEVSEMYKNELDMVAEGYVSCARKIIRSKPEFDSYNESIQAFKMLQGTEGCAIYHTMTWFWKFITRTIPLLSNTEVNREVLDKITQSFQKEFEEYLAPFNVCFRAFGLRQYANFKEWLHTFIRPDILKFKFEPGKLMVNNSILVNSLSSTESVVKARNPFRSLGNFKDEFFDDEGPPFDLNFDE